MREKPSRLVGDAERAVQLVRADTLFARRHEAEGEQPLVKRDMAPLEDRADPYRELLAAIAAVPPSRPHRCTAERCDLLHAAAERADDAIGPAQFLKVL